MTLVHWITLLMASLSAFWCNNFLPFVSQFHELKTSSSAAAACHRFTIFGSGSSVSTPAPSKLTSELGHKMWDNYCDFSVMLSNYIAYSPPIDAAVTVAGWFSTIIVGIPLFMAFGYWKSKVLVISTGVLITIQCLCTVVELCNEQF